MNFSIKLRTSAILMIAVLLLSLFAGCGTTNGGGTETNTPTSSTPETPATPETTGTDASEESSAVPAQGGATVDGESTVYMTTNISPEGPDGSLRGSKLGRLPAMSPLSSVQANLRQATISDQNLLKISSKP